MHEGIVIKGYGGFYYVKIGDDVWECRQRGRFRLQKKPVLVGDIVIISPAANNKGVIEDILPRRTELIRPPVSNVDRAVIIFAVDEPEPNLSLLDRFLVLSAASGAEPVVCFNKADLDDQRAREYCDIYKAAGYKAMVTSVINGTGLEQLKSLMSQGITVLAGPSGVGKSSLLNAAVPGLSLKTGEISRKLKRGKHTTRHVELMRIPGGGMVADTPGFSSLHLPALGREELMYLFPEFQKHLAGCRFNGCLHNREPDCRIKEAVAKQEINPLRYTHYIEMLEEITGRERR